MVADIVFVSWHGTDCWEVPELLLGRNMQFSILHLVVKHCSREQLPKHISSLCPYPSFNELRAPQALIQAYMALNSTCETRDCQPNCCYFDKKILNAFQDVKGEVVGTCVWIPGNS